MGLICREIGDITTSKSGFLIAMGDIAYRSSAATQLANLFLAEQHWNKAGKYAFKALAFKGNMQQASGFSTKLMEYKHAGFTEENSKLYLQLTMLIQKGRGDEAQIKLDHFLKNYPESSYIKWVNAKVNKATNLDKIEKEVLENSGSVMAYDTKFVDAKFTLLLDVLKSIKK